MNQSESIKELAEALRTVQMNLKGAIKDSINPFFKSNYADLESVWEACRAPLADNGLCVIQTNGGTAEFPSVITTLAHVSGEWIRGELALSPLKKGPQDIGSCITYGRRYGLAAIVGIIQVDDDGEGATDRKKQPPKTPQKEPEAPLFPGGITEKNRTQLHTIATKHKWPTTAVKSLIASHGFDSSSEITADKFEAIKDDLKKGPVKAEGGE